MCLLFCCGAFLAQIILFVLNFLLSIFSLAVTGIGVYFLMEAKKINDGDLGYVSEAPIIVVAAGCIFSAIFFCGCCGAFCKNRCLLIVYATLTIVLATATVVFTVLIFQGTDELKESAKGVLTDTFSDPQNKETLGMIEAALGCCGTTGPEYYNSSVPMTCCRSALQNLQNLQQSVQQGVQQGVQLDSDSITSITNITSGDSISLSCPVSEAYEKGCVEVVIDFLSQIFDIAGKVLICIIVIEYVAAFLAIFLTCYIGK